MSLAQTVSDVLEKTPVVDFHTHLFAPEFGQLNLWGIDELLTYHYLVAEGLRADPGLSPEAFFALDKTEQADFIWQRLFIERTPLSEATIGAVSVLNALGLDHGSPLAELRSWFKAQDPAAHLCRVMELAGVELITMTNDPFDPLEAPLWKELSSFDSRFAAALRIDPLVHSIEAVEFHFAGNGDRATKANRFLDGWVQRMDPRYVAVSVPPDFCYQSPAMKEVVLPTCRRHGLPFALMIGVRRAVNPRLKSAGDGIGLADLSGLQALCSENPDIRFMATTLAKENHQQLCVLGRKFANLGVFGCWWFSNNPSIVEEITDMRFEMLGDTFIPQHSDARVFEQLIYKWRNSRTAISRSLTKRLSALEQVGHQVSKGEIDQIAKRLFHDNPLSWTRQVA